MLVLTEVSEAVEADRKCRHADIESYEDEIKYGADVYDRDTRSPFEKYIKDTVEDELADVCIRIFDLCGTLGIEPEVPSADASSMEEFRNLFGKDTFCERMYGLTCLLIEDFADDEDFVEDTLGSALFFIMCLCKDMEIDLERHIELKMRYNELRPCKHGKSY